MLSALSVAPLLLHDTGVSPTRTRRQFTATYKLQILAAADACTKAGELGALLRREGLYSSHLAAWRAARRRGDLQGPTKRRGPARSTPDPARKQVAELERQLAKATARAERAELIIDAQKKFSQLLGLTLPPRYEPTETRS
jgi:transposase